MITPPALSEARDGVNLGGPGVHLWGSIGL